MRYLLDTNILSETRKRLQDPGVRDWVSSTPRERMHLSVLTIGEIDKGIAQLRVRGDRAQAAVFDSWLDDVIDAFGDRIVSVTLGVAREWGALSPSQPAPAVDALIGATAEVNGWTLVTRNTKDFERTGVRLLNPFTG